MHLSSVCRSCQGYDIVRTFLVRVLPKAVEFVSFIAKRLISEFLLQMTIAYLYVSMGIWRLRVRFPYIPFTTCVVRINDLLTVGVTVFQ